MNIREISGIFEFLKKRKLIKQYQKAKFNFQNGDFKVIDAKKRKPKSLGVFQFKINDKYRAFYVKRNEGAVVFKISDHQ